MTQQQSQAVFNGLVTIINNSLTPPQLPVATTLGNTDLIMIWNNTTNQLEQLQSSEFQQLAAGSVLYTQAQTLTEPQQLQARTNIGLTNLVVLDQENTFTANQIIQGNLSFLGPGARSIIGSDNEDLNIVTNPSAANEGVKISVDAGVSNLAEFRQDNTVVINGVVDATNMISQNQATANNHLVRLDQMNSAIIGIGWLEPVEDQIDMTTAEPASPSTGDRYINTVSGTSNVTSTAVVANNIYEWNGSAWDETVATEGHAVWDRSADTNYNFNGTSWVEFGSTVSHNNTTGLQGGTTSEYYHMTQDQHTNNAYRNTANTFTMAQSVDNTLTLLDNNQLRLQNGNNNNYAVFRNVGGAVSSLNLEMNNGANMALNVNNSAVITVSERMTLNKGLIVPDFGSDNAALRVGSATNGDLLIYHDGTDTYYQNQTGVNFYLGPTQHRFSVGGVEKLRVNTSDIMSTVNLSFSNNVGVTTEDSGGTDRSVIKMNASNQIDIGAAALATSTRFLSTGSYEFSGGGQTNFANKANIENDREDLLNIYRPVNAVNDEWGIDFSATNSEATPAETVYANMRAILASNDEADEDGRLDFNISIGSTLTQRLSLQESLVLMNTNAQVNGNLRVNNTIYTNATDLVLESGGIGGTTVTISDTDGELTFGGTTITNGLRISASNPPATSSSTGTTGQIEWDENFIYVCVDTDDWKRVGISTW